MAIRLQAHLSSLSPPLSSDVAFRNSVFLPSLQLNYAQRPLRLSHAQGVWMVEEDGRRNLDCINNVTCIGHSHPEMSSRIAKQITILNTNSRFLYDCLNRYTKKLLSKFPPSLNKLMFFNSGSEANDFAIQLAALHTKRSGIICLEGGYHGVTKATMQVSHYKYSEKTQTPKHVKIGPSPCTYRGRYKDQTTNQAYLKHIQSLIDQNTGCFISQLMQSCGGQVIPRRDFYRDLYPLLHKHGIVTICDQVQTGFGRLGSHFWAFQYYGVVPDIVTIGKAMGNGIPVSAVVFNDKLVQAFVSSKNELFSTFGGNPIAITAAQTVFDVIQKEGLQRNALQVGNYLKEKLQTLRRFKCVGDIRGQGLFQGIQIVEDGKPSGQLASKIKMMARDEGVLVSTDGLKRNILKMKPPLIFSRENAELAVEVLTKIIAKV